MGSTAYSEGYTYNSTNNEGFVNEVLKDYNGTKKGMSPKASDYTFPLAQGDLGAALHQANYSYKPFLQYTNHMLICSNQTPCSQLMEITRLNIKFQKGRCLFWGTIEISLWTVGKHYLVSWMCQTSSARL